MALTGIFAALYAVGILALAPISFGLFQIRIADVILPLAIIFGLPAIIGVTLGNVVGNFASPFGAIDIVGGTVANFVASLVAWRIGSKRFHGSWVIAILIQNLIITFIVGTYLSFIIGIPSWVPVFIGSFIAMNIGGYALVKAVDRRLNRSTHATQRDIAEK